jgi:hypothetical protein
MFTITKYFCVEKPTELLHLQQENDKLQREPVMTIVGLQEELIAVKLREAEANLSMKEMRKMINDLQQAYDVSSYNERIEIIFPEV